METLKESQLHCPNTSDGLALASYFDMDANIRIQLIVALPLSIFIAVCNMLLVQYRNCYPVCKQGWRIQLASQCASIVTLTASCLRDVVFLRHRMSCDLYFTIMLCVVPLWVSPLYLRCWLIQSEGKLDYAKDNLYRRLSHKGNQFILDSGGVLHLKKLKSNMDRFHVLRKSLIHSIPCLTVVGIMFGTTKRGCIGCNLKQIHIIMLGILGLWEIASVSYYIIKLRSTLVAKYEMKNMLHTMTFCTSAAIVWAVVSNIDMADLHQRGVVNWGHILLVAHAYQAYRMSLRPVIDARHNIKNSNNAGLHQKQELKNNEQSEQVEWIHPPVAQSGGGFWAKMRSHKVLPRSSVVLRHAGEQYVPLSRILGSTTGRTVFYEYLRSEYNSESLMLYSSIEQYEKEFDKLDADSRCSLARELLRVFIGSEAVLQVNIDDLLEKRIVERVCESQEPLHNNVFDELKCAILHLMEDPYMRFKTTPLYESIVDTVEGKP